MLSDHIGIKHTTDDQTVLHTHRGEVGHAVYGPYAHTQPGTYRVDFKIALLSPETDPDTICATLDVTANEGRATLVSKSLHARDLGRDFSIYSLNFTLREFRSLEFRVYVNGTAELLVCDDPHIIRLSDPVGDALPADPRDDTNDPVELHRQIRAVLRLLRPHAVKGFRKVRLGNISDGGYVCIDDFAGLDTALSFGINNDITWDCAAADRGLKVYQFDHTVEDPAPEDGRMVFAKKRIASDADEKSESIANLVRAHDRGLVRPNIMLKMDIEASEWDALAATSAEQLSRFSQIVCELHYFQGLDQIEWRRKIFEGLEKLHKNYAVIHVHANICGGISNIANVLFPNVIEVTFVNRAIYEIVDTEELFPGPLDVCCDADQPDMFLGSFRF